jgi:beta-galactosidase
VDTLNSKQVEFTLNLGDATDRNFNDLDSVLVRLHRLRGEVYHLTGNHDYKGVTDNLLLYTKLNMPALYYFFQKREWLFVMLTTNEIASYSNVAGTAGEAELAAQLDYLKQHKLPQLASWNGGVSTKQLKWLDRLLSKAERHGSKVLLFSHHPLHPEMEDTALNNRAVLQVIDRHPCVKALFAGHHHAGSFAYYHSIPAITVEGMVETEDTNAFAVVKLYDDKIVIDGYGRVPSRTIDIVN